jgi:hypothetical protein
VNHEAASIIIRLLSSTLQRHAIAFRELASAKCTNLTARYVNAPSYCPGVSLMSAGEAFAVELT